MRGLCIALVALTVWIALTLYRLGPRGRIALGYLLLSNLGGVSLLWRIWRWLLPAHVCDRPRPQTARLLREQLEYTLRAGHVVTADPQGGFVLRREDYALHGDDLLSLALLCRWSIALHQMPGELVLQVVEPRGSDAEAELSLLDITLRQAGARALLQYCRSHGYEMIDSDGRPRAALSLSALAARVQAEAPPAATRSLPVHRGVN